MRWAALFIFSAIGLGALSLGIKWGLEACPLIRDNLSARGTVVEIAVEKSDSPSGIVYSPVIAFSTRDGKSVRIRLGKCPEGAPEYEVGDVVELLYDPRNPANARPGSIRQLWSAPLTAGGVGSILIALSVLLFIKIGSFEKGIKSIGPKKEE